jgi:hypothetical protein
MLDVFAETVPAAGSFRRWTDEARTNRAIDVFLFQSVFDEVST